MNRPFKLNAFYSGTSLDLYSVSTQTDLNLKYFPDGISAGFPSPAADFITETIDLNKHLIKNPASTFVGVAKGVSMMGAGINDGDLLIIDKAERPLNNRVAVCVLDNDFTLKRLILKNKKIFLAPENPDFPEIDISQYYDFEIWGILTHSIKKHI